MARPSQCPACGCFEACLFPETPRCAERIETERFAEARREQAREKQAAVPPTPVELRTAADTLEKWGSYMGYPHPEHAEHNALSLRTEATHLESENLE